MVALCVECKCFLCQDCNEAHSNKYKSHDILSLSSTGKGPAVQFTGDKAIYHHVAHTHDIVENTASEHRNMLMKIITPVEEMSENLSNAMG